ncbi:MAG: signal peptidase I [Candidatus Bathyarchaeia archaeon]|nr:signal peptidase I [Candidatus Bathyarchaeota archaeon]
MKAHSEKTGLFQKIKDLRKNGLVALLLLLTLLLVINFVLQGILMLVLKTSTPLHTPISGSMEPTLNVGDLLIIQGGVTGESLYAHAGDGDIIIYHDPRDYDGIPIVHRAVDKYQVNGTWYIVTKGDANSFVDDWSWYGFPRGGTYNVGGCPESYVIGKVIFSLPYLGGILSKFDEPMVNLGIFVLSLRHFLIIILLMLLAYLELAGSKEEIKETSRPEKPEKCVETTD